MESELLPDKEKDTPPVPIKTYQWEDVRRAREAGGYPWTHLLKIPLEGVITADDIIRETTPRRSMSREFSRSRTHSPADRDVQRILNLDSSPGSSRKHGEEGEDEGVHIPVFSKEVSLDSEDDAINQAVQEYVKRPDSQTGSHLVAPAEIPKSVSPKSILKRRVPEQQYIGVTETREKTKCCHPLVNKIKHLADKTLHKLERNEGEKSPQTKRKKNETEHQEIRQLKSSPGAVRRQKFGAIKLGDSDEMSKTLSIETPPTRKKREHTYEDIDEKSNETEKVEKFNKDDTERNGDEIVNNSNKTCMSPENKSISSQDPSLIIDETTLLKSNEQIMQKIHGKDDVNKEALLLDEEMDADEPNVDDIFQNQLDESRPKNDSPNITITEIIDDVDDVDPNGEPSALPIETSPSPSPREIERKRNDVDLNNSEWSKPNSDHEYEIIEKPSTNIIYNAQNIDIKQTMAKTDDELSSTTSLERKYLQNASDEDEHNINNKENIHDNKTEDFLNAETLQKDIEDRFFVNTPSTVSRTECEVSTSQVDSSALENLPLKRGNRSKAGEGIDNKIQQRIKEGTGKLKTQAGKLKSKLQNMKTKQFSKPEKPKINFPSRSKIKMPERPKFSFPERPKFTLPERPKFKMAKFSEKLTFDRKFSFPERPKFNVPELPKFKMPDRPKMNFPSFNKKKEYKVDNELSGSSTSLKNVATVEFEAKTYPRFFSRKKKELPKTSSSPTLNKSDDEECSPPPTFTFTRVKKSKQEPPSYHEDNLEQPREYGELDNETGYDGEIEDDKQFDTTYDFDKIGDEYMGTTEPSTFKYDDRNANSIPDLSPTKQEYTHINEINNDEFFVRPRGISRENIQVREYLSDEIRQAFKIPKNVLALMGSNSGVNDDIIYANEPEADPELTIEDDEPLRYSPKDTNDGDDGYYTFPPVRPSRAKRKNKELDPIEYIDDCADTSMQFNEIDLGDEDNVDIADVVDKSLKLNEVENQFNPVDLHSIHEYANDDILEYPENVQIQSQTLPTPPKRKKKQSNNSYKYSSLNDFKTLPASQPWDDHCDHIENIIVYRTEHEYIVPQAEPADERQSPVAPRRNRSRSSRGTSLCDDDRTSHGAESLTLDAHLPPNEIIDAGDNIRNESPGYATVDKGPYVPSKGIRRSKSKTPPARRRKSNSSERKYYTVDSGKPDRPPRKKSSTSLMTLDNFAKMSTSTDLTQYVEIDEPRLEEIHKDLKSGEIVSKMKDRPLPPPPRPPRGPKKEKKNKDLDKFDELCPPAAVQNMVDLELSPEYLDEQINDEGVIEIDVSTQTDPLPNDVDFELGMDDNLDMSVSSSLRDIVDEESILNKSHSRIAESPRISRPTSRSEKSVKLSDPKMTELSRSNVGRTSPTVILVERRVSSPTRINERDEMLTEASLTVQHIDIDEAQIPDVPPLPKSLSTQSQPKGTKNQPTSNDNRTIDRVFDTSKDVTLDNLVTQRLQVRDLDVGKLNVSELQASKILVSDIEGMTLQVAELDSKSGHISVSGIEFSQSVIDEIVKKFAEITTTQASVYPAHHASEREPPQCTEEHTQTDALVDENKIEPETNGPDKTQPLSPEPFDGATQDISPPPRLEEPLPQTSPRLANTDESIVPPQRPPPPDLTPLLYSYLQDMSLPSSSFYSSRPIRERPYADNFESHQSPPPPTRRAKRKPTAPHSESSSDSGRPRPSPRRMPPPVKVTEPSITEAGAQFLRVCQNSISRTLRSIFNSFMNYINGTEDKKDMQMALVIFLVLIAGLIMFGLSDSRTIHHHHWEFFNPPDGKQ